MKKIKIIALCLLVTMSRQTFAQNSEILVGPWISNVSENSATILWTTASPGKAWVELEDGTRVWETFAGRRIFGRSHTIKLQGLPDGSVVRYRVGGQLLISDENPRDPKFGDTFCGEWHRFKLFDPSAATCDFTVFNDIHLQKDKYRKEAACVDSASTDFIFLNGDIVSNGNYDLDTFIGYSITPLGAKASGIPLMFARGNHEGRGNNTPLVKQVYPNDGPGFYYSFRSGPVAFLVFDQGETHTSRSTDYSGTAVFEDYLFEQLEWAKRAVQDSSFSEAPVKVCFIHAGMFDDDNKDDYHLQRWMNKNIVPFLNEAGIDLMISADLHEYRLDEPGRCGNDFPIYTNDDAERLHFTYGDGMISLQSFDSDGNPTHSYSLKLE